nr:putative zinc finger, CCHC-type [Tanacetum cinerariifolium]
MASYTDPKQVWHGLKTRFLGVDRVRTARLATLRKELETMRMKEGEAVDDFLAKLNGIASRVRSLGYELEEVDLVKRLLNSMPKPFFQIVASIEQCFDLDSMSLTKRLEDSRPDNEGFVEEAMVEVKEVEEEVRVEVVIKAGSGVLIVENLDTLVMSAQNGRIMMMKPI